MNLAELEAGEWTEPCQEMTTMEKMEMWLKNTFSASLTSLASPLE